MNGPSGLFIAVIGLYARGGGSRDYFSLFYFLGG